MKILTALTLTASVLTAAPYVGLSVGFSSMKDKLKYSGYDTDGANSVSFNHSKNSNLNSVMFGLLGGYAFKINDKLSILAEADVNFGSKKKTLAKFDSHPEGLALDAVEISTRRKHSFGFMPAVSYNFTDKVSGLVGIGLNWTKHEVTAHTTEDTTDSILVKNSKHVMGLEPTAGLGYKINDKIATRLTLGYNLGKKTTMINQIVTDEGQLEDKTSSGKIVIKPRGLNVRLTTTYSF